MENFNNNNKGIVIVSASRYSAYSLSVIHLLEKNNINIDLILVKSFSGRKRLMKELKTSGFGFFIKIYKKIVLQNLVRVGFKSKNIDGFSEYFSKCNIKTASLVQYANAHKIKYIETPDFHLESIVTTIRALETKLIVFTGGGLLRAKLINTAKYGVINCHMGILPKYRGMDCNYWAFLNKDYNSLGFTVHIIDSGVDTGPIIRRYYIDLFKYNSIAELYKFIEYSLAEAMVDGVCQIFSGKVDYEVQKVDSGKQYYTITPELSLFAESAYKKISASFFFNNEPTAL